MDPDPGGKNLKITTTTHAENLYRYIFILLSKFGPAPWFYTFGQSFLSFNHRKFAKGNFSQSLLSWIRIRI